MAEINANAQQTLDSLLTKLGAKKLSDTTKAPKTTLGQEDFLKLMTAQLSNQDPFQPQSNDQMIAQMAQFSTVSGITQLNNTMTSISTQIAENRIATAANFIGKTVLVPGNVALADDTGSISGAVDLPKDATNLNVQITKENGEVVKSLNLGAHAAGLVGFSWDGKDDQGKQVGAARYLIKATMTSGGAQIQATTDVYAPITEARVSAAGEEQTVTVGGVGVVRMSDIRAFKY
ncbi:MAG: flagellar hook assembly protein FlgD [Beijerinckiaceae bacterium]|jgi:flagellar basal-body rod modification protein FlgD